MSPQDFGLFCYVRSDRTRDAKTHYTHKETGKPLCGARVDLGRLEYEDWPVSAICKRCEKRKPRHEHR